MKQTKRRNFKRPLSLLLAVMMLFTLIPAGVFTVGVGAVENETITADTSWYNDTDTEFTLNDAADLLGFAELASGGNVFTSKTIKLGADIDLNPGWSAVTSLDKDFTYGSAQQTTVTFPSAPLNVWTAIPSFEGTFDGQGHTIRGIYVNQKFTANGDKTGMFCYIKDGTVKNLVVKNSLIRGFTTSTTYFNVHVGGIVGRANNSTVSNIFCDMEVWYCNSNWGTAGGIVGTANTAIDINNCVFNGVVGNGYSLSSADATTTKAPCGASAANLAQILGQGQAYANTITDCLAIGKSYYLSSTGNRYGAITPSTASTATTQTRCYSASVTEADTPEGWTYRWDYNTALPNSLSAILPTSATTMSEYASTGIAGSSITVSTAEELILAAQLSQSGDTFSGKTIVLTANIDLNPNWDAAVTVTSGKATLPAIPTVIFPGFATFSGTLDGQNHTINGIFMTKRLSSGYENLGFIEILKGNVQNVKFSNSLIFADIDDGVNDCKIGGVAARTTVSGANISNVYSTMNVWYRGWSWQRIAGIVGKTEAAATINNVVFAGTVGTMTPANATPTTTTDGAMSISPLIADGGWKSGLVLTACDFSKATTYAPASVTTISAVAKNDSANKTNIANATTVTAPAAAGTLEDFNIWPSGVTAQATNGTYEGGNRAYVKYYKKASLSNYNAYLSTLETNGYTAVKTYTVGNNNYALYEKEDAYTVYVSYLAKVDGGENRMRVFVEPFGTAYNTSNFQASSGICSADIWQLDVGNGGHNENGGMGYVIRQTDGTFIVIDGGYNINADSDNLYNILLTNNVLAGKPVIAAWFITHLHNDHYGCLTTFAKAHSSDVTVKAFYYNFNTNDIVTSSEGITNTKATTYNVLAAMGRFPGAVKYSKLHSGMTVNFTTSISATVLCTHEDVMQGYYTEDETFGIPNGNWSHTSNSFESGNDASLVIKFTIGTQTFMITGDASGGESHQLLASYPSSVLKSDIVQVSHHGYDGLHDKVYKAIDADVALWPMDVVGYNSDGTTSTLFKNYLTNAGALDFAANDWLNKNTAEIIPAWENVKLQLPYTAKTYSGGSKTIDLDKAYQIKLAFDGTGVYVQKTATVDNKFDVRFIAVVDVDMNVLNDFSSVGFNITIKTGDKIVSGSPTTTCLYTSVLAAGETVTAESLGGTYMYVYVIKDVPADTAVEFDIAATVSYGNLTYNGNVKTITYGA